MTDMLNNANNQSMPDPKKNVREEAFDLVDEALKYLSSNEGTWLPGLFELYTTSGQIAKDILLNNNFISMRGHDINDTNVDITEDGLAVVEMGGYRNFISAKNETIGTRIEKENLELQQLRTNVKILTSQLVDYDKTKSQAKWAIRFSILLVFLELLKWLWP